MICWIEINIIEVVSGYGYGYVGHLRFVELRLMLLILLVIMDMWDIFELLDWD